MSAGRVIKTVAAVGAAGIALYYIMGATNAVRVAGNAMIRVVGIKNIKLGFVGVIPTLKFDLQLECTNATGQAATFDTFAIAVKDNANRIGGKTWAQIDFAGPVRMSGRELSRIINIPTKVNFSAVMLTTLIGPAITTLYNRIMSKKPKEPTPAQGQTPAPAPAPKDFVSLEQMQAKGVGGLGATGDEINLLNNIKKSLPKVVYIVGNVRVNGFLLPLEKTVNLSK